jgi:hypothetical protein
MACNGDPAVVYVPREPPKVTVEASASPREVKVGEAIVLHAKRHYRGEWVEKAKASLPEGACWMQRPPPAEEIEVADNLHWTVLPAGSAQFNLDFRADHSRELRFSAPGQYSLQGHSAVWCGSPEGADTNRIHIVARPK